MSRAAGANICRRPWCIPCPFVPCLSYMAARRQAFVKIFFRLLACILLNACPDTAIQWTQIWHFLCQDIRFWRLSGIFGQLKQPQPTPIHSMAFALLTCFTFRWIIHLLGVNLVSIIAVKILIYTVFLPWKLPFSQNCDFYHSVIVLPLLLFYLLESWMTSRLVSMDGLDRIWYMDIF